MRRRAGLVLLAAPALARAQPRGAPKRLGLLSPGLAQDATVRGYVGALFERLATLGWQEGRNLEVLLRWGAIDAAARADAARAILAFRPDIIVVSAAPAAVTLLIAETRSIPIVFVNMTEAALGGFVADRAHPGGNVSGFLNFENALFAKWVQLLVDAVPGTRRIATLYHPASQTLNPAIGAEAERLGLAALPAPFAEAAAIDDIFARLAGAPPTGVVAQPGPFIRIERQTIMDAALRHRVPMIWPTPYYGREGGLLAYGVEEITLYRRAAVMVDRILRGAWIGDLPVEGPVAFEFVVNLGAARAISLDLPASVLQRADAVID